MPLIFLPIFGPDVFGMNVIVTGSVPQTTQTQQTHFWQKPGCLGAIAVTAVGAAATAGEVLAVMTLAPEVGAVLADAVAEDALLGAVHAGEIATGAVAALLAPPIITVAGAGAVAAICF
jgi:expansin (peptidoglycan-binding protein)